MGRDLTGAGRPAGEWEVPALIVTAAFFLLGSLAGCFLAFHTGDGGALLNRYLESFLTAAEEGSMRSPGLTDLIWRTVRWPLASVLLGFTAFGLPGIPILCLLRGFFLSFSVASFAAAYGYPGLEVAFLLLGISGLLTVPVFFVLSVQGFCGAGGLASRAEGQGRYRLPFGREQLLRTGVCAGALLASVFTEYRLVPLFLMGFAGRGQG